MTGKTLRLEDSVWYINYNIPEGRKTPDACQNKEYIVQKQSNYLSNSYTAMYNVEYTANRDYSVLGFHRNVYIYLSCPSRIENILADDHYYFCYVSIIIVAPRRSVRTYSITLRAILHQFQIIRTFDEYYTYMLYYY